MGDCKGWLLGSTVVVGDYNGLQTNRGECNDSSSRNSRGTCFTWSNRRDKRVTAVKTLLNIFLVEGDANYSIDLQIRS